MTEQRSVDARGDERPLERPHAPLGVGLRDRAANRVEEPLRIDSVPVHLLRSIERQPDRLEGFRLRERWVRVERTHSSDPNEEVVMHTDVWTYRDTSSLGANIANDRHHRLRGRGARRSRSARSTRRPTRSARATSSSTPARGSSARRSCSPPASIKSDRRDRGEDLRQPDEGRDQERARVRRLDDQRRFVSRPAGLVLRPRRSGASRLGRHGLGPRTSDRRNAHRQGPASAGPCRYSAGKTGLSMLRSTPGGVSIAASRR